MSNGFKIIAIQPLEGCESSKILKQGEIYYFCNDYEINLTEGEIIHSPSIPKNLYNIPREGNDLEVNIHAIVGENGTGKSSVVELLAMAINDLSKRFGEFDHDLDYSSSFDAAPHTNVQFFYQVRTENDKVEIHSFEIYNESVSFSQYRNEDNIFKIIKPSSSINFDDFFYTFLANYSLYALNEAHVGHWVHKIFHKREAYQVPLNIYPLRNEGNIDVNNEMHLTKSRLLSNILIRNEKKGLNNKISDNQHIIAVPISPFELNLKKKRAVTSFWVKGVHTEFFFDDLEIPENLLQELFNVFEKKFNVDLYKDKTEKSYGTDAYSDTCNYIIRKLFKIPVNYEALYWEYFYQVKIDEEKKLCFNGDKIKEFLIQLKNEDTVITLKLRQAINFIDGWETWQKDYQSDNIVLSIERLSQIVYDLSPDTNSFIEYLPPPVYELDFWLSLGTNNTQHTIPIEGENYSLFKHLSSGEKQIIFSVQSVLYHLLNLNSIHNSKEESLRKYRYANLIFDEIELYFHPEFQRRYISEILKGISRIYIPYIKAINMCFVTHSPFILSDIPEANCMFLKVGKDGKSMQCRGDELKGLKTFGANIHDMLRHGFFMKSGFVGEWAKNKINILVDGIKEKKLNETERNDVLIFINNLGEPLVKERLLQLYNQYYTPDYELIRQKENIERILKQRENEKDIN